MPNDIESLTNEQLADFLGHFTDGMREELDVARMTGEEFKAACLVVAILDRTVQIVREA